MPKHKTCKRYNDPGHAHALTFSCFHQQPLLSRDRSRQWFIDALDRARSKHALHVWAYVIMPEHAHLLVWPTRPGYDISGFLQSMKTSVTRVALAWIRANSPEFLPRLTDLQPNEECHYRFWQRGGGYDRNVLEPASVWNHIVYIHANPVRRGLCAMPEEWYWSSAADYARIRVGPLRLDRQSLPPM
jgi:putative transposase